MANRSRRSKTRYVRKRRQRKRSSKAQSRTGNAALERADTVNGRQAYVDDSGGDPSLAPVLSHAPRRVEPPPRNPNIFTYTYTIWKTS